MAFNDRFLLYDRVARLNIAGADFTDLRMSFSIRQTASGKPDKAEISVWNLQRNSRVALAQSETNGEIALYAGYAEQGEQFLFSGDLRRTNSRRDAADWVSTLYLADGENSNRDDRVNKSYPPGTDIRNVVKDIMGGLTIDTKDAVKQMRNKGVFRKSLRKLAGPRMTQGSAMRELESLLKGMGLEFTVQQGTLVVAKIGQPAWDTSVPLIAADSGLVGSPEIGEKGRIKIVSLLRPDIRPMQRIELDSRFFTGAYRVEQTTHTGDTYGQSWYTEMEASPL